MSASRPHVAASDGEEIHPGRIGQPAHALSSLAFVAAAVPIARAARRRGRPAWLAVAAASAVEGIGSVAYHGPGGQGAKRLHDAGLVALVATVAVAISRDGTPVPRRPWTAGLATSAVVLHTPLRAVPAGHDRLTREHDLPGIDPRPWLVAGGAPPTRPVRPP